MSQNTVQKTPAKRIQEAITVFQKNNIQGIYTLDSIPTPDKDYLQTTHLCKNKDEMLKKSKLQLKNLGKTATETNGKITYGYLIQVKHSGACVALIVLGSSVSVKDVQANGFTFVQHTETSSKSRQKKRDRAYA